MTSVDAAAPLTPSPVRLAAAGGVIFLLASAPAPQRIERLLGQMTLEEKLGQLLQFTPDQPELAVALDKGLVGSVLNTTGAAQANALQRAALAGSRLRIPLLIGHDVIHGYRTIFPIPLGIAASWDPGAAEQAARVSAREARAAGIHWTFAPMVDIARDPRWGRIAEGSGEDPVLAGALAAAWVRGFQGSDPSAGDAVLACAKHFAGYGAAMGGRDYAETDIPERTLREIYLPPFRAAADAGVATFMSAFNTVNGVPATANPFLLDQILRKEWRYPGMVVSDWAAVAELINHGVAATREEAALAAITAGIDMNMWDGTFATLAAAVRDTRLPMRVVDAAVRRVLRAKEQAGLFDRPFADEAAADAVMLTPEHRAAARQVAQRSLVLLKNENLLPLAADGRRVALVGPLASARADMLGPWFASGAAGDAVSLADALRQRNVRVVTAMGTGVSDGADDEMAAAVDAAKESDVVIAVLGESREMSGEAASRASIDLPGRQRQLFELLAATGKPMVVVVVSGRPLAIPRVAERARAVIQAWFPGTEAGHAIADVLFGDVNPSAKLPVTVPRATGQIPIGYAQLPTGRPAQPGNKYSSKYADVAIEPLYPFGHGLSYTRFEYSDLRLSAPSLSPGGRVTVSASVRNTGARAGDEIVQLYIRDLVASVARPVRELKAFRRLTLAPGEAQRVEFALTRADLQFWGARGWTAEPGQFKVWIAPSSAGGLEGSFTLTR